MRANLLPITYAELNDLLWQEGTFPQWIDIKNGEVFEYSKFAIVRHNNISYMSLVDNNVDEPINTNTWILWGDVLSGMLSTTPQPTPPPEQIKVVVQPSNKIDNVTMDAKKGKIQCSSSPISAGGFVTFRLSNKLITNDKNVVINIIDGSVNLKGTYFIECSSGNGFADITINNRLGSAQSDAILLLFTVLD